MNVLLLLAVTLIKMLKLRLDSLRNFPALYIGLSAGVDSLVLLHLVYQWAKKRKRVPIYAIHVHHGLQQAADDFANHSESVCANLNIPLHILKVQVTLEKGESLEAAARSARYKAMFTIVPEGAALLLGHHANDQAENFLLRALRGSGLRGLSGMQMQSQLMGRYLLRPMLSHSRTEIEAYATEHGLIWIEDPTNQSTIYTRNFLRNTIFPQLNEHFPKASMSLSRAAMHLQEVNAFMDSVVLEKLHQLNDRDELSIQIWSTWHPLLQKLVLQKWIELKTGLLPSELCLKTVINEVIQARLDRHPEYHWHGWWFKRKSGFLEINGCDIPNVPKFTLTA